VARESKLLAVVGDISVPGSEISKGVTRTLGAG
jgi:hypothetical protein